jgi:hypothetical protein
VFILYDAGEGAFERHWDTGRIQLRQSVIEILLPGLSYLDQTGHRGIGQNVHDTF